MTTTIPALIHAPAMNSHRGAVVRSPITSEARLYALKELARRAGVTAEFFNRWKIQTEGDATVVYVESGTDKRIRFPNTREDAWRDLFAGKFVASKFDWMWAPRDKWKNAIPQFIVPYVRAAHSDSQPLFSTLSGSDCAECSTDLLLSCLFSLSRLEELVITERDKHGRVPASASLALKENFLMRPIVDEYGFALQQVLEHLVPGWKPAPRMLHVNISHDVDNIGIPFRLRAAIGHSFRHARPDATLQDFLGVLPNVAPWALGSLREMVLMDLEHGFIPAVYWKGSLHETIRETYDPFHPKVRNTIRWLQGRQVEIGVHPGYDTFRAFELLNADVETVRSLAGLKLCGGRQDYLRWCPETWKHWEDCGLAYDSSVGYADHIGFRAGTCLPYHPWSFEKNAEMRLTEIPLIVMDGTLEVYMKLSPRESLAAMRACIDRCSLVGGVFSLLWHNDSPFKRGLQGVYAAILKDLSGHPKYDGLAMEKASNCSAA